MKKQVKVSSRESPTGKGRQKFAYLTKRGDQVKSNAIGRKLAETKSAAQARKEVLAAANAKKVVEKKEKKGKKGEISCYEPGNERPTLWLYDKQLKAVKDWQAGQEVVLVMSGKVTSVELNDDDKRGKRASARVEINEIGTI